MKGPFIVLKAVKFFTLALLVVCAVGFAVSYVKAPLFWTRYIDTFTASEKGAKSPVFDFRSALGRRDGGTNLSEANESLLPLAVQESLIRYATEFDSHALLIVYKGELQLEWYSDSYDRDALTQSQSMHKSLQALLVGVALEQGLIENIDAPIGSYLPSVAGTELGSVSIRDYLQMSSGLKPFEGGFSPFGEAFRWLYSGDINAATLAIPQIEPAGSRFDYHDANTQMIGMLLTAVFQQPYASYLEKHLWRPIGGGAADVWLDNANGVAHHNCCLLARAMDWAKVGQLVVNSGQFDGQQIVSAEWIAEMSRPGVSPNYGLQLWIGNNAASNDRAGGGGYRQSEAWLADDVVYFSGYGAQRVYMSQQEELVIVRLGPAAGYFPKIADEWDNVYFFNTVVRSLRSL